MTGFITGFTIFKPKFVWFWGWGIITGFEVLKAAKFVWGCWTILLGFVVLKAPKLFWPTVFVWNKICIVLKSLAWGGCWNVLWLTPNDCVFKPPRLKSNEFSNDVWLRPCADFWLIKSLTLISVSELLALVSAFWAVYTGLISGEAFLPNPEFPRVISCLTGFKKLKSAGLFPTVVENCLGLTWGWSKANPVEKAWFDAGKFASKLNPPKLEVAVWVGICGGGDDSFLP